MKFLPLGKFLVQNRGAAEAGSGQLHGLHSEETAGAGPLLQREVGETLWVEPSAQLLRRGGCGNASEGAKAQELGRSERRPSARGNVSLLGKSAAIQRKPKVFQLLSKRLEKQGGEPNPSNHRHSFVIHWVQRSETTGNDWGEGRERRDS